MVTQTLNRPSQLTDDKDRTGRDATKVSSNTTQTEHSTADVDAANARCETFPRKRINHHKLFEGTLDF